jgi:TonB dependent receptor
VPGVTTNSGTPDTRQSGGSVFGRVDLRLSAADSVSLEGIFFPHTQRLRGLSPLRAIDAAPTLRERDLFGGIVGRHAFDAHSVLTLRLGLLAHQMRLGPPAAGQPEISPSGWSGGFFSTLDRRATRLEAGASWQKQIESAWGVHDLTFAATGERRELSGSLSEQTVEIRDANGRLVRVIHFGPPGALAAEDDAMGVALRDLWRPREGLQIDAGLRGDTSDLAGFAPSARVGFRYSIGDDSTVVKGGLGTFVGSVPLAAAAFGGFPPRLDHDTDDAGPPPVLGLVPRVGSLALPRALAANLRVERRIAKSWDALLGVGVRRSSRLATLTVEDGDGQIVVASDGRSTYRGAEAAVRHTWREGGQLFVSYTRSSARGEINDFSSLFASGDAEILRPGGVTRLASDAPNRLLAWATITLPAAFGLSPAVEWRSGFPYSVLDSRQEFVGLPNSATFPAFFSLDLVVDKTLKVKGRRLKLQVQLFNATNHFNPRDVFAVAGAPRFGTFVNSVGPTFRGDIGIDW